MGRRARRRLREEGPRPMGRCVLCQVELRPPERLAPGAEPAHHDCARRAVEERSRRYVVTKRMSPVGYPLRFELNPRYAGGG